MSLSRLRRSSRFVAALLLIVSSFGLPHRSNTDDNCLPFGVEEHDESNHVFKAVTTTAHPEHCAICHWTRWLKPDLSTRTIASPVCDAGSELAAITWRPLRNPSSPHLPSRAPPRHAISFARLIQLS